MPFPTLPDPAVDREHERNRWHPERETLEMATAGAAQVLGPEHNSGARGPSLPSMFHELLPRTPPSDDLKRRRLD